jgi:DNA gyrase inhibitor GyrI
VTTTSLLPTPLSLGELFRECEKLLPKRMLIGVYYDDPETVPEEKLCYAVGVIMAQSE